jgi:hypothetical protein
MTKLASHHDDMVAYLAVSFIVLPPTDLSIYFAFFVSASAVSNLLKVSEKSALHFVFFLFLSQNKNED